MLDLLRYLLRVFFLLSLPLLGVLGAMFNLYSVLRLLLSLPCAALYSPKRLGSIIKTLPSLVKHDVQINLQYKRFLQSDIKDIEDLEPGCGGILNSVSSLDPNPFEVKTAN